MSFSRQISKFTDEVRDKAKLRFQKIAIDLFSNVIIKTPKDTGRATGNWTAEISSISGSSSFDTDTSGGATVAKMTDVATEFDPFEDSYISLANNLPYIERLEYEGYSPQQKHGWVRAEIAKAKAKA